MLGNYFQNKMLNEGKCRILGIMGKKVCVWIYVCVYVQSLVYNKNTKKIPRAQIIVIAFLERTYVA